MADYSTAEDLDIPELQQAYGFEIEALVPLPGGMANSSFTADSSHGRLVISILDNQDDEAARRLADVVVHMRGQGIPTNEVIPRLDGQLISMLRGKRVLIKRWLDGQTHPVMPDDLLPSAAELLGRIHDSDPTGLDVPIGGRRLSALHRTMLADFPNQEHADWVRSRLRRLDQYFPPANDPRRSKWTPVHGDFIGSNIVTAPDDNLWVIDWETATIDDPMLDVGMSVMSMCLVDSRLDQKRVRLFVDGYERSGRPLEPELLRSSVEYASVIVAFHRYRRHHIRFPNPARFDHYRFMVDFVEAEFPLQ